jgi:hypothetical protein
MALMPEGGQSAAFFRFEGGKTIARVGHADTDFSGGDPFSESGRRIGHEADQANSHPPSRRPAKDQYYWDKGQRGGRQRAGHSPITAPNIMTTLSVTTNACR